MVVHSGPDLKQIARNILLLSTYDIFINIIQDFDLNSTFIMI